MLELFIYYRVAAGDVPQAVTAVRQWQAALRARHPGLQTRLLRKHATGEAQADTWMETYAANVSGHDLVAELRSELAAGPPPLIAAATIERHVEAFEPCAS